MNIVAIIAFVLGFGVMLATFVTAVFLTLAEEKQVQSTSSIPSSIKRS